MKKLTLLLLCALVSVLNAATPFSIQIDKDGNVLTSNLPPDNTRINLPSGWTYEVNGVAISPSFSDSAELRAILGDENGTGAALFDGAINPTLLFPPNAMGALAIDVTKRVQTKTISGNSTFTLSGTPSAGQSFGVTLSNSSSSAVVATLPSGTFHSEARGGSAVTTISVPPLRTVTLEFYCESSGVYTLYGEPVTIADLTTKASPIGADLLAGNDSVTGQDRKFTISSVIALASAGGTWGSIAGTLSDQTDLQSALNAKLSSNGDGSDLTFGGNSYNTVPFAADLNLSTNDTLSASNIITGTLGINRIPTGTSSITVALGDHTHSGVYEPVLGNPSVSGYVLSSTTGGARSWVAQSSAGAPTDATYITQTSNGTLTNEQALGSLATGLLKNTTTTGVLSIGTAGTDYVAPGGALGTPSSGTLTNATGLPVSTGISGLGTGVAPALAVATNSAGGFSPINGTATFTNKTIDLGSNTVTGTKAQFNSAASDDDFAFIGAANTFTAQNTFAAGTITTSQPLTLTQTWNASGVSFTGLKVNITNTAAASGSLLLDLQLGGSSAFAVRKDGRVYVGGNSSGGAGLDSFNAGILSVFPSNGSESVRFFTPSSTSVTGAFAYGIGYSSTGSLASNFKDSGTVGAAAKVVGFSDGSIGAGHGGTWQSYATTPSQITADQNNYNPAGSSSYQRWSTDASRSITGLTFTAAQVDGQTHVIVNVGSNNIVIVNESASSTAANRFHNSTGADITIAADQEVNCWYDATSSRWRVSKRGF